MVPDGFASSLLSHKQCVHPKGPLASQNTGASATLAYTGMSTALSPTVVSSCLHCWCSFRPAWRHPQWFLSHLKKLGRSHMTSRAPPQSSTTCWSLHTPFPQDLHRDGDTGLPAFGRGNLLLTGGLVPAIPHLCILGERPASPILIK